MSIGVIISFEFGKGGV